MSGIAGTYTAFLKDKRPIILLFLSGVDKDGRAVHFNSAARGTNNILRIVETHLRTIDRTAEYNNAKTKIEHFITSATLDGRNKYSDLWIPFGDDSWVTLTFNPAIQDVFRIPRNKRQETRNASLITPNGHPRWVRVYDYLNVPRPNNPEYRYTIVFIGNYRVQQKRRGLPQSGYYYIRTAEDPKDYFQLFEDNEKPPDQLFGQGPIQMGRSMKAIGKRIEFAKLPLAVKQAILREYVKLWEITDVPHPKKRTAGERQTLRKNRKSASMKIALKAGRLHKKIKGLKKAIRRNNNI